MDNIRKASQELNCMLLEAPEYKQYLEARSALEKFPQYKDLADSFRRKQIDIEARKINGEAPEAEELSLANDYADICLITVCNDFFQAEMALLTLIKDVCAIALQNIDVAL